MATLPLSAIIATSVVGLLMTTIAAWLFATYSANIASYDIDMLLVGNARLLKTYISEIEAGKANNLLKGSYLPKNAFYRDFLKYAFFRKNSPTGLDSPEYLHHNYQMIITHWDIYSP